MKLAFTCGDPAGIGPEIIEKWLVSHPEEAAGVALIGPANWLESAPVRTSGAALIPVGDPRDGYTVGQPSVSAARTALAAMERAAAGTMDGEFSGVVTGPVSKSWLQKAGYTFPGQTEFFAARWGGEPTMVFCGGKLRVALLSWHIPLRDVPAQLTLENFRRTVSAADRLARACGPVCSTPDLTLPPIFIPRIAVCGLNPHAGEDGLLGREELEIIDPMLDRLRPAFPGLSPALPGDTVFARQLKGEFDVVVALYHDQGLAPLKTIDFDQSVNVTLGLRYIRTSPDHGTAFGIAGKGLASGQSFENAVSIARRLL